MGRAPKRAAFVLTLTGDSPRALRYSNPTPTLRCPEKLLMQVTEG
jgi:hypothetical protein